MASREWTLLLVTVALCLVMQELWAQADETRAQQRARQRQPGTGNRPRNGSTQRGGGGRGDIGGGARGRGGGGGGVGGGRGRGGGGTNGGSDNSGRGGACEEIQVPMCKGLVGYTSTKLPNRFNHTTQLEVYRVLEHMWALIDRGCSQNFRLLVCSLFLPKCAGRGPAMEPCETTCTHTKRICESRLEQFGYTWPAQIDCAALPNQRCLKKERDLACTQDYTLCEQIDLPMCSGLRFSTGMSPNMFGQCNRAEIAAEMEQFRPLVASGCSAKLQLLLCGVYMPFCTEREGVLAFPCQELCVQVRDSCSATFSQMTGGLPWPNKFQCHRYPSSANVNFTCVMADDLPAYNLPTAA